MSKQLKKKVVLKIPGLGEIVPGPDTIPSTPGRPWPEIEKKLKMYRRKGLLIDWEEMRYAGARSKQKDFTP